MIQLLFSFKCVNVEYDSLISEFYQFAVISQVAVTHAHADTAEELEGVAPIGHRSKNALGP